MMLPCTLVLVSSSSGCGQQGSGGSTCRLATLALVSTQVPATHQPCCVHTTHPPQMITTMNAGIDVARKELNWGGQQ